jgi:hypothetical protein
MQTQAAQNSAGIQTLLDVRTLDRPGMLPAMIDE